MTRGGRRSSRIRTRLGAVHGPAFLVMLVAAAALVAAGWLAGRQGALADARAPVARFVHSETLAGAIDAVGGDRAGFASAYDDPAAVLAAMDRLGWSVPNMPTPFVGTMPVPGTWTTATISHRQFRRVGELAVPKPPGIVRIFLTGGSTAFGVGAPSDAETIPGFLEGFLNAELAPRTGLRYEVVNAANPAWLSTHERILIENRLSELEPDLVISFTGVNDAHFGFLGNDAFWMRTYAETHFLRLVETLYRDTIGRTFPRTGEGGTPVEPEDVARRLRKNVVLAAHALAPTGATYLVCLQPALPVTKKALTARERGHLEREILGKGVSDYFRRCYACYRELLPPTPAEPNVRLADLTDALDDESAESEVFLDSYHFGNRGNRILARRLLAVLEPLLAERASR